MQSYLNLYHELEKILKFARPSECIFNGDTYCPRNNQHSVSKHTLQEHLLGPERNTLNALSPPVHGIVTIFEIAITIIPLIFRWENRGLESRLEPTFDQCMAHIEGYRSKLPTFRLITPSPSAGS